jgi:hypothetical protein
MIKLARCMRFRAAVAPPVACAVRLASAQSSRRYGRCALRDGLGCGRRSDGRGRQLPTEGVIDFFECLACGAFHADAVRRDAAQEYSAGFGLELKEIGTAK